MNQSTSGPEVFTTNPYAEHPNLSETEAEVLWQYAKLSQNIKEVRATDASLHLSLNLIPCSAWWLWIHAAHCRDTKTE